MVLYNVTIFGPAGKDSANVPWSYVEDAIANLRPGQACSVSPVNAPGETKWYGNREAIEASRTGAAPRSLTQSSAAEPDLTAQKLAAMQRDGSIGPRHDRGQKG